MRLILRAAHPLFQFRDDVFQNAELLCHVKRLHRPRTLDDANELVAYALAGNLPELRRLRSDTLSRLRIDDEIELGRDTHGTQHTERTPLPPLLRVSPP